MALLLSKSGVILLLPLLFAFLVKVAEGGGRRQKREWIIPPRKLQENVDYSSWEYIAKIRSDEEYKSTVTYSLTGAGADSTPIGLFTVNPDSGLVKVNGILDREDIPSYHLLGVAKFKNGSRAEKDIDLRIIVEDKNDCAPVFQMQQVGYVKESSAAGTVVMVVNATDADEEGTLHSLIFFSLVESSTSAGLFIINHQTGEVLVRQTTLDRETLDTHTVTVKGMDMNGALGGNSGTGEIVINILDINDNIPTLEKETYEGSVMENTINVEVLRIKAIDLDLMYSVNWLAVFSIVTGNEAGYFSITTNAKTNEGIITILKPLDYEELKTLGLTVTVANKAPYDFGHRPPPDTTPKSYPIKINVVNQKEGPRFQPSVKVVTISEDRTTVTLHKVITNYAAIDSDTLKIATNVFYAKLQDDDNWLIIDEKTADIKLNKWPDRESIHLINGTYYAKIICISKDVPSKTATGTIAIQVDDFNDHCPTLVHKSQTKCLDDSAVYVTAVDGDDFPNSAPFDFRVISENNKQKWIVEPLNETTVILRDQAGLWPGSYKVSLEIRDQQGKACTDLQVLNVDVCTCDEDGKTCVIRETSTATFGASGVLLFLLGLLLLLLVPLLLLFCLCGGAAAMGNFKAIPYEAKSQLISYHTEGQGEDKEVPLLQVPVEVDHGASWSADTYGAKGYLGGQGGSAAFAGGGRAVAGARGGFTSSSMFASDHRHLYHQPSRRMEVDSMAGGTLMGQKDFFSTYRAGAYDGIALSEGFLEEYYASKASHAAQQPQQKDSMLIYDYEGRESPVGSVGCCSLFENEDDLEFLNDLGPKFKTLAEICRGTTLAESTDTHIGVSVCRPPRTPSPPMPSTSTHTHTHTHTERVRDVDHIDISSHNMLSASSIAAQNSLVSDRAQGIGTLSNVHVQDKIVIPNQALLIQQPTLYYTAAPMYVVDSKPQMVLVAGGGQQAGGQVGLGQGLVHIGGLQGSQGMVLVERREGGMGGGAGKTILQGSEEVENVRMAESFSQGSSRSRQVLLMENASGGSTGAVGSAGQVQGVLQVGLGSSSPGLEVRDQGFQGQGQSFAWSSNSQGGSLGSTKVSIPRATARPRATGGQKVVVQQKKISVTERNMETTTRA